MFPDLLWSHRVVEARMKAVLLWAEESHPLVEATPQERRLRSVLQYLEKAKLRHRATHAGLKLGILRPMIASGARNTV